MSVPKTAPKFTYDRREVEITEIELEIGEGVYVISANFVDTGTELTDSECDQLAEKYQSELYEDAYADLASRAHDEAKDFRKYGDS